MYKSLITDDISTSGRLKFRHSVWSSGDYPFLSADICDEDSGEDNIDSRPHQAADLSVWRHILNEGSAATFFFSKAREQEKMFSRGLMKI